MVWWCYTALTLGNMIFADHTSKDPEDDAYHISICSPPGVEWVSHQIGKPGFKASARRLSVDMKRNERLETIFDSTRSTEPDRQTALKWTKGKAPRIIALHTHSPGKTEHMELIVFGLSNTK